MANKVIVAGGSGLVGSHLVQELSNNETISKIICLGRTDKWQEDDRVEFKPSNFEIFPKVESPIDAGFCCLGTTIKDAGSKEAFEKVDYQMVVDFAGFCRDLGAKSFHLVSAYGANGDSLFYYPRVKGKCEQALMNMGFQALFIYHPSLLIGARSQFRLGEEVGKVFYKALGFGPIKPWIGTRAEDLAKKMVRSMLAQNSKGTHIIGPASISS